MMRYLAASAAVLGLAASSASAAVIVNWQPVTISAAAIAHDATLANMQTWDLIVTTTEGNWASAGMRAVLPAGNVFYKNALGGNTKPNPAFFPIAPSLEYTTYVSSPNDNGSNNNTLVLGGFPEDQPQSLGNTDGVFSTSWGDLFSDLPSTFQIARLTFPQGVLPNIINVNDVGIAGNWSRTSEVNPDNTVEIPDIPEPATLGLVAAAGLLAIRRRK